MSSFDDYLKQEDPWQQEEQTAPKAVHINLTLIAKRNLSATVAEGPHDDLIAAIMKLTHIRLDRENIGDIDNLEMLGPVTNVYLQQNKIKTIENLDSLMTLRFLTLAGNQIDKIENMRMLDELKFLDLSENQIESFDPEELPKSLMILNLTGNPCTRQINYRASLLKALPNLQQLDLDDVTRQERLEAGCEVSDTSDDDDDEEDGEEMMGAPVVFRQNGQDASEDVLQLSADIILESQSRTQQYMALHEHHMDEIEEVRAESQLAMNTGRSLKESPRSDGSESKLSR